MLPKCHNANDDSAFFLLTLSLLVFSVSLIQKM